MTQSMPTELRTEATPRWKGHAVLILCFVAIVFDGYDLVVYGSTVPRSSSSRSGASPPRRPG